MKELKPNKYQEMKLDLDMLKEPALNDRACTLIAQHIHKLYRYINKDVMYAVLCRCLYAKWGVPYEVGQHPDYFSVYEGDPHIMFMLRYMLTVGDGKEFDKEDLARELGETVDSFHTKANVKRLYFVEGELTTSEINTIESYFWRGMNPTQDVKPVALMASTDFQKLSAEIDALKKASEEQAKLISSLSKGVSLIVPTVSENISLLKKEIGAIKEDAEKQPKLTRILIDEKVENPPVIEDAPKAENTTTVVGDTKHETMPISESKAQEHIALFNRIYDSYKRGKITSVRLSQHIRELFDTIIPINSREECTKSVGHYEHIKAFDVIVRNCRTYIKAYRGKEEGDRLHIFGLQPKSNSRDFIMFNKTGAIFVTVKNRGYAAYYTYSFSDKSGYDNMLVDLIKASKIGSNPLEFAILRSKYLEIIGHLYRGGGLVTIHYFLCHLATFGMDNLINKYKGW